MTTARKRVDLKRVGELMPSLVKAGCPRIRGADLNLLGPDWREETFRRAKSECTSEQMGAEQDVKQSPNEGEPNRTYHACLPGDPPEGGELVANQSAQPLPEYVLEVVARR